MAVPSSGAISLTGIGAEVKLGGYDDTNTASTSLTTLATTTTINTNSASVPDAETPHAMSEWYGYDHDAAPAFTDNNAVAKSITTGSGQAIFISAEEATTAYSLTQADAFTIAFWIKVGWDNNLNTNVHLFAMNDGSTTGRLQQLRVFYNEANNRLEFRIGHNSNNRSLNFWPLHSHTTQTGISSGSSNFWSSSNRGNVNGNDYTHLVISKGTGTTLAASNIAAYWNGSKLGNAFHTNGNNFGTVNMSSNARQIALGSNAHTLEKCGNNNETKYNVLTIFDKQLSDSEVTTLYGGGSPVSADTASNIGNLVGYYNFESDGSESSNDPPVEGTTFSINGNSNIEAK